MRLRHLSFLCGFFPSFVLAQDISWQLTEAFDLRFRSGEGESYQLECADQNIPFWLKFDGNTYVAFWERSKELGLAQDLGVWDTYLKGRSDLVVDAKNNWEERQIDKFIARIRMSQFSRIFTGTSIDSKKSWPVDLLGSRNGEVREYAFDWLNIDNNTYFYPQRIRLQNGRYYAEGSISGEMTFEMWPTAETEAKNPGMRQLGRTLNPQRFDVNLDAKLHLNTGVFTRLDGDLMLSTSGQQKPVKQPVLVSCTIDGNKSRPLSLPAIYSP
jgi:hypothetical protein